MCNIGIVIKYLVFMCVEIFAHVNVVFFCNFYLFFFLSIACCCYCYAMRAFFLDCLKLIIYLLINCEKNNIYMHMQVCMYVSDYTKIQSKVVSIG